MSKKLKPLFFLLALGLFGCTSPEMVKKLSKHAGDSKKFKAKVDKIMPMVQAAVTSCELKLTETEVLGNGYRLMAIVESGLASSGAEVRILIEPKKESSIVRVVTRASVDLGTQRAVTRLDAYKCLFNTLEEELED